MRPVPAVSPGPRPPRAVHREMPTAEHAARLVLARDGEDWGEVVFAIRIAPFARDVAKHLDELTLTDLRALHALGRAAERVLRQHKRAQTQRHQP